MNKQKLLYFLRQATAIIFLSFSIMAFWGYFYEIKIFDFQIIPLIQNIIIHATTFSLILLAFLILTTLLFGRIYCSLLCPLGLFQEVFSILIQPLRRLLKIKNHYEKTDFFAPLFAAVLFGTLFGGTAFFVRLFDPYTLFGNALSGAVYGTIVLTLLAMLILIKGRFFCTHICPVGSLLGFVSRFSLFKINIDKNKCKKCGLCEKNCPAGCIDVSKGFVNNEACIKCLKCLPQCKFDSLHDTMKEKEAPSFNLSRRQFIKSGVLLAVLIAAGKTGNLLAKKIGQSVKNIILPAGAGNAEKFANTCLNCNLCVQNCPMKIIKKASADFPVVHLDYQNNFCNYDCHKCSSVCPSGAIKKITLEEKQKTKIGTAVIDTSVCVRCGLCVRECPRQIIIKEDGSYPLIDTNQCIGCGACQNVCPVQAIKVEPVSEQKILN